MVIAQGEVWWAELGEPIGSAPGYTRPAVIVQSDSFNRSRIGTVLCVPVTSNTRWADAPGCVPLDAGSTGLPSDSVAVATQLLAVDRSQLLDRVGRLPDQKLELVLYAIDVVLGR